jgi:hypothetical protein
VEALPGRRDHVDRFAVARVRMRAHTGGSRLLGGGRRDPLGATGLLDLGDRRRGTGLAEGSGLPDRDHLELGTRVPGELDREVDRLGRGLGAIGGSENRLHPNSLSSAYRR